MTREQAIEILTGANLFGRKPSDKQIQQAKGLLCAASVMLGRGQSNAAYDIILAGFALFEVAPIQSMEILISLK